VPPFFVDTDGDNEPTVWRTTARSEYPDAVLRRCDLPVGARRYWSVISAAMAEMAEEPMSTMTQTTAPVGTVATLGHPANRILIVKTSAGFWRYVDSGGIVDGEDFRAGWDIYTPDVSPHPPRTLDRLK
jgi:hypothetical protein